MPENSISKAVCLMHDLSGATGCFGGFGDAERWQKEGASPKGPAVVAAAEVSLRGFFGQSNLPRIGCHPSETGSP